MDILKDIVIIFALSSLVNFLFTRIRIPTIIGYLLTGIIVGPHLLKLIHAPHEIELMAEIGVVLLLFSIGLEFSVNHLFKIRRIVFLGGFIQLLITALVTMMLGHIYGMNWKSALFVGFITALSSTAVVLKILSDRSESTSNYGRTVIGILIFQDLVVVPLLLFTPLFGGEHVDISSQLITLTLKTILIIGMVYVGNKWVMPKILHWIVLTKNQELFLMTILLTCLSVALLTSQLGMSLSIGAFLAGLMISDTEYSHNAFGNLIPFKDTFTSFFFVSIGMLLDLNFVYTNFGIVVLTVFLVISIKAIIAGGAGFLLGHTFRGTVMLGLALSQVGEFSFILSKLGFDYGIISPYFYDLFLAVAIITMSLSPFLMQIGKPLASRLLRLPLPDYLIEGLFPLPQMDVPSLKNHIVLIGKDSRSENMAIMARHLNLPYISIVFDPAMVRDRQQRGDMVVYGDAVNEPILQLAHVDSAEVVVISVGDLITAMAITQKVRNLNKHAYVLVRTKSIGDIPEIYKLGANQVIPEEFETAIEMFERILVKLLVPRKEIDLTISGIRDDNYGIFRDKNEKFKGIVFKELPAFEISTIGIGENSEVVGKTLDEVQFRKKYEVTTLAIKRNNFLIEHPDRKTVLQKDDILYLIGKPEKIAGITDVLNPT